MEEQKDQKQIALFAQRLNKLLDISGVPEAITARIEHLAGEFLVSPAAARKWVKGEGYPTIDKLRDIAIRYNSLVDWLLGREIPDFPIVNKGNADVVAIPVLDHYLKEGHNGPIFASTTVWFERSWLHRQLHIADCRGFFLCSVNSDAMWPTIRKREIVFVDSRIDQVEENAIYMLVRDNDVMYRRLQKRVNDMNLYVTADNKNYPEEVIAAEVAAFSCKHNCLQCKDGMGLMECLSDGIAERKRSQSGQVVILGKVCCAMRNVS